MFRELRRPTLVELLIIVTIVAIVIALLVPETQWAGSGWFDVVVRLEGAPPAGTQVHFAVVRGAWLPDYRANGWRDVDWWSADEAGNVWQKSVMYDVFPDRRSWRPGASRIALIRDTVLVRYTANDGSMRVHRIPIHRERGQRIVEITAPATPSDDADVIANPAAP